LSHVKPGHEAGYNPFAMGALRQAYWPDMNLRENAEKAIANAANVSFIIAGATALLSLLAWFDVVQVLTPWSLVDAAIFAAIGMFVRRGSRAAAVAGILVYLTEAIDRIVSTTGGSVGGYSALILIFSLYMINGVRGAYALARLRKKERGEPEPGL
jgi:hypothetical protein